MSAIDREVVDLVTVQSVRNGVHAAESVTDLDNAGDREAGSGPIGRDPILLVVLAMPPESNDEFMIFGPERECARPLAAVQLHDGGHIRKSIGQEADYFVCLRHGIPATRCQRDYGAGR